MFPKRPASCAVQLLLGRTNIESTVRYLGIEFDDAPSSRNRLTSEIGADGVDTFRPNTPTPSRYHYAAKRNSRTSSKICRKAGSGAWHMVRYVSRKGSQPNFKPEHAFSVFLAVEISEKAERRAHIGRTIVGTAICRASFNRSGSKKW